MRAVVLRRFGGPENLVLEDVPTPTPQWNELLMRVRFVSVNRVFDLGTRRGSKLPERVKLPLVLGVDPTGEVAGIGEAVKGFKLGERIGTTGKLPCGKCSECEAGSAFDCHAMGILGVDRWGGYAEYVAVPAATVFKIPAALSLPEATVIFRHFPAAYHLVLEVARLEPGEVILIMGASGALATSAIQVAKMKGATVIAAAGAAARVEIARSYGADFGVSYADADLPAAVDDITSGRGVDVVFDNIGDRRLWDMAFRSLARGGRLVSAGSHGGGRVEIDVDRLFMRRISVIGAAGFRRRHLERTRRDAVAGLIRPIGYRVMPLREAAAAHQLLESDRSVGKILLETTDGAIDTASTVLNPE
jgi:NADPH:quinone reductase-like Zn-dependent oxidoreductase